MEQVALGNTGIKVSRLCFGVLTIGPLQSSLPLDEGAALLVHAIDRGITFFDTAQEYQTYPYIRRAIQLGGYKDMVICSKTYADNRELAVEALEEARRELDRDYIDIFLMHEQESEHTLRGHQEAIEYLLEQKQRGVIGAVGASTHRVAGVQGAAKFGLDVIHPLLNVDGLGIRDGSRADMEQEVKLASEKGLGVFLMKTLGAGSLFRKAEDCLNYALSLPYAHSIAIGMQSVEEIDANVDFFEGKGFSPAAKSAIENRERRLIVSDWCTGCKACFDRCGQDAFLLSEENKAVCVKERCILCGYCSAVCPGFAIKII